MGCEGDCCAGADEALGEIETRSVAVYEITALLSVNCPRSFMCSRTHPPPQRIHRHEDDLVENPLGSLIAVQQVQSMVKVFDFFKGRQSRKEGLVGEEACRKHEYRNGYQNVG